MSKNLITNGHLVKTGSNGRNGNQAREKANDKGSVVGGGFTLHGIVSRIDIGII